ncbi:glycosyltransferase family 2 protein [Candidatus Daviesbacteria bacterium]|nr:glycosyltransferase family 2 protein [Candidatus Daviesbacteria bacterium]
MKGDATHTKVSVIIPNWNGKHLLKVCLPSLRKQMFKNFEVVVVDNGSTDGSIYYIKKYFPKIKLVELSKNTGFAPAVNLGIKICVGDYIVLLNNDTKSDKSFLRYLVKAADHRPEAGMIAAKILKLDDPNIIDSTGAYIDAVGHANNIGIGEKDGPKFNKSGFVFLVSGGGCLIKREVFKSIGFFDEDFFAYMEDVDFSIRAQIAGFKAWYEPKAILFHKHKATSIKNRNFLEYLQFRNMSQMIIKNYPLKFFLQDLNLIKIILVNLNTVFYLSSKGFLVSALKAEAYIFFNFIKLLNKRKTIQANSKVSYEYIVQNIKPKRIYLYGFLRR